MTGSFWEAVGALNGNLTSFGFVVVGVFAAAWAGSILVYRLHGLDRLGRNADGHA